ncbi:MAG: peptide ABC transporter substrate-binding protein [Chloroflexi bacterium]|nr:peptide ABC transporter substrate-binding protein [Chloroflexota bacterium]
MKRKRLLILSWPTLLAIIGGVAAVILLWRVVLKTTVELKPAPGGIYTEGVAGNPGAINPLFSSFNDVDKDLVALIFSGLTKLGKGGEILPDLAESWDIGGNGRVYTFHLRQGVKWHDGVPFTAEDVLFTIKAIQDPGFQGSPDLALLWRGVEVKEIDDYTVQFTLAAPHAPFLAYTTQGIVPAHLLQGLTASQLVESPFNAKAVGTGPFIIKEASIEGVLLASNPDYFLGQPYLSAIGIKFYPDDEAALTALTQKRIDGLLLRPGIGNGGLSEKLKGRKGLAVRSAQRPTYNLVFFNLKSPLFQDKTVRQALLYGLDRNKIIAEALGGQGVISDSPIDSQSWAYEPQIKSYSYDPQRAETMLDAAGWKRGTTGFREKDGTEFRFSLLTNNDPRRVKTGEEVVRQWRRLGIRVDLQASGSTGLFQNFLIPRQFQAILFGLDPGYDPDGYSAWHSSQASTDGFNIASYSNGEVDNLLQRARQTTDMAERTKLYRQFQDIFAEEVPSILLYYPTYLYAQDKKVKGVSLGTLYEPSSRYSNVKDWYIKTKKAS